MVAAKVLQMRSKYPHDKHTVRPFRLWLSNEKRQMQWRNYAFAWSALEGAWHEAQWLKAGESIEIFNITSGQHIGTFSMKPGHNVHRYVKPDYDFRFNRKGQRK